MIPEHTLVGLDNYIGYGIPTGDFLHAVLSNDLFESFGRADCINSERMFDIVKYIYQYVPRQCWGDKDTINEWLRLHKEEPEKTKQAIKFYLERRPLDYD
jgi:hypothetical protein